MSIGQGRPFATAAGWGQEWQRLGWTAVRHALRHYLRGCADVAMAGTPKEALAALHRTQTSLLRHSVETLAQAAGLWRRQNTDLFVIRTEHASRPEEPTAKPTTTGFQSG